MPEGFFGDCSLVLSVCPEPLAPFVGLGAFFASRVPGWGLLIGRSLGLGDAVADECAWIVPLDDDDPDEALCDVSVDSGTGFPCGGDWSAARRGDSGW